MNFLFLVVVNLGLILVHTAILPFVCPNSFINLVTLYVIYLSLHASFRDSLLNVIVSGLLLDCLSGGPFGLYLTIYFWLFIGFHWVAQYVHSKNRLLLPVFIGCGVFFENIVSIGAAFIMYNHPEFVLFGIDVAKRHLVGSLVAGPFFILLLSHVHQRWRYLIQTVHERRAE